MDEHTLTQMMTGVSNQGLPPGCYVHMAGIAAKQRKVQSAAINRRLNAAEKRLDQIEQLLNELASSGNKKSKK